MNTPSSNTVIGKNISTFRETMGLNQEALALYLGISQKQLSFYESGAQSVPSAQLSKLASLFCLGEYDFYQEDVQCRWLNMAFVFWGDHIKDEDLQSLAQFRKIVRNYLNMKKIVANGGCYSLPAHAGL